MKHMTAFIAGMDFSIYPSPSKKTLEGEVTGQIDGETVYHASLKPDDYIARLKSLGFKTVEYLQETEQGQGPYVIIASGKS